ncbi:MAG: GNAT family N-acetyltransferase [Gemmatimonadetes bacterium]|nr:GNAT family N-acetyltransferase [Gemmatimonadota bacterium]
MEFSVTRCEDERLPDVGLFFKRQYKGRGSYGSFSLFYWKLRENYVRPGFVNVVRDRDAIVSTTSITPKRVLLHGSLRPAAEIGDTYTDAGYQRRGLFSLLVNQSRTDAEQAGMRLIYGTPNTQSLPGYLKNTNFGVAPQIAVSVWVFPINVASLLRGRMFAFPASLLAALGELVFHSAFRVRRVLARGESVLEVREENRIPEDWDAFWSETARGYDFIVDRSREALEWRFFRNPNEYQFVTIRRGEAIVGFVCSRFVSDAAKGTQLIVADVLTRRGEEETLLVPLSRLVEQAFAVGATMVSTWLSDQSGFSPIFKKLGFIKRSGVPVIAYRNEVYDELAGVKTAHFTMSDTDNV